MVRPLSCYTSVPSWAPLPPAPECCCCSSACCCSSISTLDCSEGKISEETATSDNEVHLWHKMAEYKDMHSSSPERTLKLQVAAEQLLTGECWIPPKRDTPHPRAKEKPQQDGRRSKIAFRIKLVAHQRCSEGSNKPCAHQDPEIPQTLRQNCV